MNYKKNHTACFTGHRVIHENETESVQSALDNIIDSLVNQGITAFLNGGAVGFDMLAAERVISFKIKRGLAIKLIMILPCKNHEAKWNEDDKVRLRNILKNADEIIYLSEKYYDGCMAVRNQCLADNSGICVTYMKKKRSGASQTVRMATERGLAVINLAEK